jgi:hypothetical protein
MKKIIIVLILFVLVVTGQSSYALAYEVSPQTPYIGDVQSINRTYLNDIKRLSQSDLKFSEASIVYTESSTYLYLVTEILSTPETGLFYTMPALYAGYYPGKLDFVYTDIRSNGVTVMTIQVDGNTSAQYAADTIDENQVIRNAIVKDYSKNTNTSSVVQTNTNTNTITSNINGNFRGFKKGTTFKLTNNQIWEQTSYEYQYTYLYRPEVTIYKDGTTYYMIVDGMDNKIAVKRIK